MPGHRKFSGARLGYRRSLDRVGLGLRLGDLSGLQIATQRFGLVLRLSGLRMSAINLASKLLNLCFGPVGPLYRLSKLSKRPISECHGNICPLICLGGALFCPVNAGGRLGQKLGQHYGHRPVIVQLPCPVIIRSDRVGTSRS